ncbi:hypothetical protein F4781DRAFT_311709 [Annulohypoxylon bovei var. microspora]|nr:hypothetical protein F4781DRAFT_311709 [Annulohypoxylon bovei var. microspora]
MDLVTVASTLDLSQMPLVQPPPGVQSNFDDPPTFAPAAKAIVYTTWSLMIVFLFLRFYARARITRSLGVDDYLCMISAACVTAESGVLLSFLGPKMGPHGWDVPVMLYSTTLQLQLVILSVYLVAAIFLKSSVIFFNIRIFRPKRSAVITLWVSLGVIVVFNIAMLISGNAVCDLKDSSLFQADSSTLVQIIEESNITQAAEQPGANVTALMYTAIGTWIEKQIDEGHCGKAQKGNAAAQAVFSAVTDFYALAISIGLTLSLRLSLKRKVAVCAVFLVGLLACACSIVGAYYRIVQLHNSDITWISAITFSVGVAEHNIGIVCSSMPVIPVLYKRVINSSTWLQLSTFFTQHKPTDTKSISGSENLPPDLQMKRENWIQIPRATLTGLRTLIMRSNRTRNPNMTEASAYIEIGSVSEEYHTYMREEGSKSYPMSHIGK